jgi:hypothetical protein
MWLHAFTEYGPLGVPPALFFYVIERGPIVGSRWLAFLRDLRRFLKGD